MAAKDTRADITKKLDAISENIKKWHDVPQKFEICDKEVEARPKFISVHYIERDTINSSIDGGGIVANNLVLRGTGMATIAMIGTERKGFCVGHGSVESFSRDIKHINKSMDTSLDFTVKYALKAYLEELSNGILVKNDKNYCRLSNDDVLSVQEDIKTQRPLGKEELRKLSVFSSDLLKHRYVKESILRVTNISDRHYFIDTQGRKIFNTTQRETMCIVAHFDHESGAKKAYVKNILNLKYDNLDRMLDHLFNEVITYVNQESTAQPIKSGQYPIIFGPNASGTLFHEGLGGHLLSGEYISTGESTVFRDKLGEKIIPLDITIVDNPLDSKAHGYYTFDEEGIPAARTVLIENGILRNYLLNRFSAAYFGTKSNGHSRSEWVSGANEFGECVSLLPEPRTSNMEISSPHAVSNKELEKMLIDHCKKEGIEFGLYVDAGNGAVRVDTSEFNIMPHTMWKIYTNGRKERVNDGVVVGNAYELLKQIAGIGNKPEISLGTCGSTSGGVPVQESAPEIFLPKVTVAAIDQVKYTKKLMD